MADFVNHDDDVHFNSEHFQNLSSLKKNLDVTINSNDWDPFSSVHGETVKTNPHTMSARDPYAKDWDNPADWFSGVHADEKALSSHAIAYHYPGEKDLSSVHAEHAADVKDPFGVFEEAFPDFPIANHHAEMEAAASTTGMNSAEVDRKIMFMHAGDDGQDELQRMLDALEADRLRREGRGGGGRGGGGRGGGGGGGRGGGGGGGRGPQRQPSTNTNSSTPAPPSTTRGPPPSTQHRPPAPNVSPSPAPSHSAARAEPKTPIQPIPRAAPAKDDGGGGGASEKKDDFASPRGRGNLRRFMESEKSDSSISSDGSGGDDLKAAGGGPVASAVHEINTRLYGTRTEDVGGRHRACGVLESILSKIPKTFDSDRIAQHSQVLRAWEALQTYLPKRKGRSVASIAGVRDRVFNVRDELNFMARPNDHLGKRGLDEAAGSKITSAKSARRHVGPREDL